MSRCPRRPTTRDVPTDLGVASGLGSVAVAALYVDPRGPYPKMPGVDPWDEARDARTYAGPHPIIAHPPCGPWGALAAWCKRQDPTLAPIAVEQVRQWGGVLEHPARSRLWAACGLPRPGELPDAWGGVTIAVNQCDWGHVATKPTWIYLVGSRPFRFDWPAPGTATHWICGSRKRRVGGGGTAPETVKFCSSEQRRRTPPAFAEFLVALARQARSTP